MSDLSNNPDSLRGSNEYQGIKPFTIFTEEFLKDFSAPTIKLFLKEAEKKKEILTGLPPESDVKSGYRAFELESTNLSIEALNKELAKRSKSQK